ncbi:hypothetical protein C8R45DRAFT_936526 [Mycena sanguinolenta]|nr:hypothetical protein C8R45DRAFT_936526 [Mycena sanguinolenta]
MWGLHVQSFSTSAAKAGRVMKCVSWDECLLAWHAFCDSRKHDHPSRRVLSTDISPSKPSSTKAHTAPASDLTTPQRIPVFTHHPPTRNPVSASSLALPATALNYTVLGSGTIHTTLEPALAHLRQAGATGAATLYMTDNAVVASHVAAGVAPTEVNHCAQTTAARAELVAPLAELDAEEKAAVAAYESAEVECTVYKYDSDDNYWQD